MGLVRFGFALSENRERKGLTRQALGDAAGYTLRAIEQWERAEREPSGTALAKLSAALGVSCEVFTASLLAEDPKQAPVRPRGRPRKADATEGKKPAPKRKAR
jgi:transcriptional regulator with XRE-family HTH domain